MREGRQVRLLIAAVVSVMITGCGIPSPPKPVGLKGPEVVGDLRAEVSDGVILLTWSLPKRYADGLKTEALGGCRLLKDEGRGFEAFHEIDFSSQGLALMEGRRITVRDEAVKGRSVQYQIITWDASGVRSEGSNVVTVNLDPSGNEEALQEDLGGR